MPPSVFFTFYTPEYDCSAGALGFSLKGVTITNESGTSFKDFEVTLTNADGTPVQQIQRNYLYQVYATFVSIGDGKVLLKPEIAVTDWIDAGNTTLQPLPVK